MVSYSWTIPLLLWNRTSRSLVTLSMQLMVLKALASRGHIYNGKKVKNVLCGGQLAAAILLLIAKYSRPILN